LIIIQPGRSQSFAFLAQSSCPDRKFAASKPTDVRTFMKKALVSNLLTLSSLFVSGSANAQRLSDHNSIGWFGSFNTIYLGEKVSLWVEYQWRRENIVTDWQQSFFRTGLQYHFNKDVSAMLGYVHALTFPYGDFPPGPHPVPDHRIFEQLTWNGKEGRIGLNHRLRFEQRFIGKVDQNQGEYQVDGWNYLNRVRYQLRATVPLNNQRLLDKTWYLAGFDEIFLGFGKNVNQNIFDQNRLGLLLGYQLNKTIRAEGGFVNVIVQQPSLFAQREVFQYNSGIMLNLYLTLQKP
jgi:hypothetical protein